MELQKNISNLPKLKIPSLFDSPNNSNQKEILKKKANNPFRFTMESSLEALQKAEEEKNYSEEKKPLRETSENWIG
ncbi:MAG: hypothetical protein N2321_05315 [Melioribacteraceae bacterium]|nr:hypothetical protein [Melioribacteraceae bacterium]